MNAYQYLERIIEQYPELTFNNKGYQYLKPEIVEKHHEIIKTIEKIAKETIEGFVEFNNFKKRKDGSVVLRCQTQWDERFTGVSYIDIETLKPHLLEIEVRTA